jgi:hypothetical protein
MKGENLSDYSGDKPPQTRAGDPNNGEEATKPKLPYQPVTAIHEGW